MSKLSIPSLIILLLFFSANFSLSSAQSCSTSCKHGKCVSPDTCVCDSGYFSLNAPCDTGVASLTNKQYYQRNLPVGGWTYFYVSLRSIMSDVQLRFQVQEGTATAYILLQSPDSYNLPTANDQPLSISPTDSDSTISYTITKEEIDVTNRGWLTLAIHNDCSSQAQVRVQYNATINPSAKFKGSDNSGDGVNGISSDALSGMVIVLPILGVGVILCVWVVIRVRVKRRRILNQQRIHLEVSHQAPSQLYELVVSMDQTPQNMNQRGPLALPTFEPQTPDAPPKIQQDKKYLSKEEISRYFPEKVFSQVKSPFPQATCSICLEDFKPESICHQLYCFHVFHEACIEEWLAQHDSCPGCRKPITREAIKKFFKEEKKRIKTQRSPSIYNVNESVVCQKDSLNSTAIGVL